MFDAYTNEELSEDDMENSYREMLDDVYGEVEIAGMTFSTSRALEELDPTAYRVGMSDYESSMVDGGVWIEELPEEEEEEED